MLWRLIFMANFYRACKSKKLCDNLADVCVAFIIRSLTKLYNRLLGLTNEGKGRHLGERHKWARAYDHGGRRYGDMTSNIVECFK